MVNTSQACKKDLLPQYQASRSAKGKRALQKCIHPGDPWTIPAMKIPFHLEICHLKKYVIGVILFWQILMGWQNALYYYILYMTWTQIYPKHPEAKTKATEILDIMDRWSLRWPRRRQRPRACSSSTATREMGRKDSLMMPNANKTMRKQWEYVENGRNPGGIA